MTRAWRAWVELWDRRESATALALVRIALGTVWLLDLLHIGWLGMVTPMFAVPPDGFAAPHDGWAAALLGTGPGAAQALWLAAVIASACLAAGLATRAACVVLVVVTAQLGWISPGAERGGHMIARVVIGILALSGCNAKWSVDAWVSARLGRPRATEVSAWPRYLIVAQLVWMYFSAGIHKGGSEWGPSGGFLALGNALADPHLARFSPGWVPAALPFLRLGAALTLVFELTAPLYLMWLYLERRAQPGNLRVWSRRLRWGWIALGVSLHLGIAVFLKIGSFPWVMLAMYPVLLRPAELQRRSTDAPANRASSPS